MEFQVGQIEIPSQENNLKFNQKFKVCIQIANSLAVKKMITNDKCVSAGIVLISI